MKSILLATLAAMTLIAAVPSPSAQAADAAEAAPRKGRGRLTHMVAFKFKDTATQGDIQKVVDAFAALPSKIPQIASYEAGTNVSPEKHDKGFTHAFLLTFHSSADRDAYLVHPDHKAFGGIVGPVLADVFVVDFWGGKEGKAAKGGKAGKEPKDKKKNKAE